MSRFFVFLVFCLWNLSSPLAKPVGFSDQAAENCVACHQTAVSDWQQSDHAKAMAEPNSRTVLGNFNDVRFDHFSQSARFYQVDNKYFIDFTEQVVANNATEAGNETRKTTTYEVAYTFGHYPLQEYLIKTNSGKMQVFPFAWDSRVKEEGGQRWYPIYPDEDIQAADRLHWQQPLQNWNGMCADCHSDGLKRNFNVEKQSFNSTYDNINVGCQSCHGKMTDHSVAALTDSATLPLTKTEQQQALGWILQPGDKVASWHNETRLVQAEHDKVEPNRVEHGRDNQFMETCFACHALRSTLTDGIDPDVRFLDQFSPSFLVPPLYHADGQIKDEVYVYGSFQQSKMFQNGVNCLDCHNKHTMKVKVEGNGLCLQCHNPVNYQTQTHTMHSLESEAGECVSCHMPETTYMGVDARRDHSFKIPRPELSDKYETPNACVGCHQDKSNQWAASQIKQHFGSPAIVKAVDRLYMDLQHNGSLPLEDHLTLINDPSVSEIKRATAIALLPNSTQYVSDMLVAPWVNSELPLIRLAVAQIGQLLTVEDRAKTFKQLLEDEFRAVRVAAAQHFVDVKITNKQLIKKALAELSEAHLVNSWRGEGNLNRSLILQQKGQTQQAIQALVTGIEVDPYFEPNYINLADLYRQSGDTKAELDIYNKGLAANPKSAALYYGYGMFQIRNGQKTASVESFRQAVALDASNPQYAYLYFLALDNVGKTKQAVLKLKQVLKSYQYQRQLVELGLSFSQKLRDRASYNYFVQYYQ